MGVVERVDRWQQRHPAAGIPVAVLFKFLDDQGIYLAVVIAFFAFFALFPLLLLLSSVLGFVLAGRPELREAIVRTATDLLPVIGQQIESRGLSGTPLSVTLGVAGALYGALGVANAVQNALNSAWNVPRNHRPNPVLLRVKGVVIILMLGAFVVATTVLAQLPGALDALGLPSGPLSQIVAPVGAFALSALLFVLLSRFGTAEDVRHRTMLPGALLAAVLWQVLQSAGGSLVAYYAASAPVTEGLFGIVVGVLGWLYFAAISLVFCFEVNAVLAYRLYPRALLAAVTEEVDLTRADRRAYARLARSQSLKDMQIVAVTFENDGQAATAAITEGECSAGSSPAPENEPAPTHPDPPGPAGPGPGERTPRAGRPARLPRGDG